MVLTGHDESNTTTVLLIDGILVSGHKWEEDASSPVLIIGMRALDAVDNGVTNFVLDLGSQNLTTADVELILDVYKML